MLRLSHYCRSDLGNRMACRTLRVSSQRAVWIITHFTHFPQQSTLVNPSLTQILSQKRKNFHAFTNTSKAPQISSQPSLRTADHYHTQSPTPAAGVRSTLNKLYLHMICNRLYTIYDVLYTIYYIVYTIRCYTILNDSIV